MVAHQVFESPFMPGDTPTTLSRSPLRAVSRIASRAFGFAYTETLGTVTSAIQGSSDSTTSVDGTYPTVVATQSVPTSPSTTRMESRWSGPTGGDERTGSE